MTFPLGAFDWQTPAALTAVGLALVYLTKGWWWRGPRRNGTKSDCGSGGCGCPVAADPRVSGKAKAKP